MLPYALTSRSRLAHTSRLTALAALLPALALAQAPTVTRPGLAPAANARTAPVGTAVVVPFSQPISAGTASNIKIFSAQYRGQRTATASVSGNTVTLTPTAGGGSGGAAFRPGETVQVSVPATVQSTAAAPARPYVYQFTTAVGSTVSNGTFSNGSDPAVGSNPFNVAVGDVDGDGDLDLVTGNVVNTVSVRLNNGSGTFSAGSDFAAGFHPYALALGDVDGDGDLDFVAANNSANGTVSVRLNNGSGAFSGGSDPAVGSNPRGVALGDVDGDGDLDLLTANYGSNSVSVRLNDGTGTFSAPATNADPAVGSGPAAVALGDVDGDGDLDLVAANYDGNITVSYTVSVRLNNGTGSFSGGSDPVVGRFPAALAVGDVDGDGDLDFVAANNDSPGTVSVRLNNGTGAFSAGSDPAVGRAALGVALGDVDGDGDLDLLAASRSSNSVSVRLNQITPLVTSLAPAANARTAPTGTSVGITFSQPISASTAGTIRIFSAQYRGQRTATASVSGNTVTLTPTAGGGGSGGAAFRPGETVQVSVPATVQSTAAAPARPYVYQFTTAVGNTGSGNFLAPAAPSPGVGSSPTSVAVGDVNGDGYLDVLTANSSGTVSVRLNNGAGTFTAPATNADPAVGANATSIALGDVNGDGKLDFITSNGGSTNTVSVRLNDGTGSFGGGSDPTVGSNPQRVAVGDVDGDGDLDLLVANYGSNTVSVLLNNGAGSFTAPIANASPAVGTQPLSVALGDVDGDGDLDALTANGGSNTVSVLLNNGTGSFTAPAANASPAVGSLPSSIALGDVNGDGYLDALTANTTDNSVSVLLNDGTGSFTAPIANPTPAVGSYPLGLALGDVDADGDLDLLTANYYGTSVSVLLNNGNGSFTAPATNATPTLGTGPFGVALGDVDGDGDLDFVTANYDASTVSVRLNQLSPPLPVVLVGFTAQAQGSAVALAWRTASEANSVRFEVERSSDGVSFVEISRVAAQGSKLTPTDYALLDSHLPAGATVLYYRLRQVDQDGTATYSPVRVVALSDLTTGLLIYPIPAAVGQPVQFSLAASIPGQLLRISLRDATGRVIAQIAAASGQPTALPPLPAGLYLAEAEAANGTRASRRLVLE